MSRAGKLRLSAPPSPPSQRAVWKGVSGHGSLKAHQSLWKQDQQTHASPLPSKRTDNPPYLKGRFYTLSPQMTNLKGYLRFTQMEIGP